jgi:hypothetical protein
LPISTGEDGIIADQIFSRSRRPIRQRVERLAVFLRVPDSPERERHRNTAEAMQNDVSVRFLDDAPDAPRVLALPTSDVLTFATVPASQRDR